MHGAAQTANAAPSRAREPLARARSSSPARRSAPARQQAHEGEPEHDEHEAGDLRAASRGRPQPPSAAAAAPSTHEDDREAERRTAGSPRPPAARSRARRAGRPRPPRPRTGSRARAAARRAKTIETQARERTRRGDRVSAIEAGELLVEPPLELRLERVPVRDQRCGAGSGSRARRPAPARARRAPPRRRGCRRAAAATRAGRSPCCGGAARIRVPELRDELVLDLALVSRPAAMRSVMNALIRCAAGESDWSSVVSQVGHMSSPSSSASVGCGSLATRRRGEHERDAARGRRSLMTSSARATAVPDVGGLRPRPATCSPTSLAAPVDEERLGQAGHPVLARRRCLVRRARVGYVDAVLARELARVAGEVCASTPTTTTRPAASACAAASSAAPPACTGRTRTPRS